jgi:hypothetical protein
VPLQTGTWIANFGGRRHSLAINAIDSAGQVSGMLVEIANPIRGIWDEDGQRLTFFASISQVGGTAGTFVATGYLFSDPINLTGATGSVIFTLAGSVEYFALQDTLGLNPSARRSAFAWYAQIGVD